MKRSATLSVCTSAIAALGLGATSMAEEAPVTAKWQVQEIRYSYSGFTTAYDCDAAADKIASILKALGAHPGTKVRATGCMGSRPSKNFFVTITAATPTPAADLKESDGETSRQELLKRLGVKNEFGDDEFPASWKTVDVSQERRLNIRPGDCELLEGLRDRVLPKLGMKVEAQRILCTPNQLSLQPPQLKVSTLVALPSADKAATAPSEKSG